MGFSPAIYSSIFLKDIKKEKESCSFDIFPPPNSAYNPAVFHCAC